jgi:putative DNA primase/helicase
MNLYEVANRLGGVVMRGGSEWIGPGPAHSRNDRSLHVTLIGGDAVLIYSHAGDFEKAANGRGLSSRGFASACDYLGIAGARQDFLPPAEMARRRAERERELTRERAVKLQKCSALWGEAQPINGTLAATYLNSRGIERPDTAVLRFHPAAPRGYESKDTAPAMLAVIQGPDGKPCGVHVTYLSAKGVKLDRRIWGSKGPGGAVRLAQVADGELAVAEGIETALAFSILTGRPTWAALDAGNLQRFEPPRGVSGLTIAADNDDAKDGETEGPGLTASRRLAERLQSTLTTTILPAPAGSDWADALAPHGGAYV